MLHIDQPVDSDMLLSLMSLLPGTPRPSELDFFLSLLHHFQSGWALKWASLTWDQEKGQVCIYDWTIFLKLCTSFCMHLDTWKAKSWYFCFSLGPRAYHHSPRILLTVLLSWFGWRWWTNARWRLLKIINAFIGRLMWSFSLWKSEQEKQLDITWHILIKDTLRIVFLWMQWIKKKTNTSFPGLLLSPSLGSALSDWVRLFPGDVERGCSCTTPGRKLKETEKHLWVYNL